MQQDMPIIDIVPTIAEHIRVLSATLRDSDKKEIESYGFSSMKSLWISYKNGLSNKTAFVNGKIAAVWGCGGVYMGKTGRPWLLTSPEVKKVSPLTFARIYQKEVKKMLGLFPKLENYVAADYEEALRLLDIIGFKLGEPETIGNGVFRKFTMEDPCAM